jgi:hypothetical protein
MLHRFGADDVGDVADVNPFVGVELRIDDIKDISFEEPLLYVWVK